MLIKGLVQNCCNYLILYNKLQQFCTNSLVTVTLCTDLSSLVFGYVHFLYELPGREPRAPHDQPAWETPARLQTHMVSMHLWKPT